MTDGGSTFILVGEWVVTVVTGIAKNFVCIFAWDWITGEVKFVSQFVTFGASILRFTNRI